MLKLKICGLKYTANIQEVAKLSPDFMGFIFYTGSKRFVGNDFVMPPISSSIKKVGVFVNNSLENIRAIVRKYKLDYVQLHGEESPEFCRDVRKMVFVIKAFGIDGRFDFSSILKFENDCDYYLFDTKTLEYGGSGDTFNKNLLSNFKSSKPFFISGGIGLVEIPKLLSMIPKPYAIDVNSKFEKEPGLKDINILNELKNELSH